MARVLRITDAASRRVSNPIFDNWTSGAPDNWTATGTPTASQVISEGTIQTYASAYALSIQNASTAAVRGYYQDVTDLTAGQTYYISVYVKPVSGVLRLYAWDGGGTANAVYVESTAEQVWQHLVVEKQANTGGIRIGLIAFDAGSQGVFDLVQIATFNIEFIEGVYDTHFRVTNWEIQVPDYKGGGVFSSSPVAEGQKLIDGYWDNVTQTISFHLRGDTDQNTAANKLGELFRALQAARDFSKTSWVRDPVYMQFKAENETNYRYAFIANARIPQLADMYSIDFKQLVMRDLDLIVEHPVSFGMPPGEGAPVLSGVRTTYNSQNYGNYDENGDAEDTAEWVHVGNRQGVCNITNMHLGTGGANLIGGSLPRNVAQSSTATYFGISSAVADSGPFTTIIFHVSRVKAGSPTTTWQYWDGSAWTALTVLDTSAGFTNLGWHSVAFSRPVLWTAASPGGSLPSGYYIRFNVSGSYSTTPQIDREIFTINKNYLEFPVTAVSGNIPALFGMLARNVTVAGLANSIDRMLGGLRSVDRGEDFQSIINLGGAQNHASIAISGDGSSATSLNEQSTGSVRRISTPNGDYTITVTISGDLAVQYVGEFRCFAAIRKHQSQIVSAYLSYAPFSGAQFETNEATEVAGTANAYNVLYDLGLVNIDLESNGGYLPQEVIFDINLNISSSAFSLDAHSLIFIPADEYQFDAIPPTRQEEDYSRFQAGDVDRLHFGSAQFYKSLSRSLWIITDTDDDVTMRFICKANGPAVLQAQGKQRLYFLCMKNGAIIGAPQEWGLLEYSYVAVRPFINPRYLGMRGSS